MAGFDRLFEDYRFSPYRAYHTLGFERGRGVSPQERHRFEQSSIVTIRGDDHAAAGAVAFWPHEFESEALGLEVFRATSFLTEPQGRAATVEALGRRLLQEIGTDERRLVVVRVDADDIESLYGLQRAGFLVVEAAATFVSPPQPDLPLGDDYGVVRLTEEQRAALTPERIEPIVSAAGRIFRRTHFYADPNVQPDRVDELYRRWATNTLLKGWGDEIDVCWDGDSVTAFFSHTRRQRQIDTTTITVLTDSIGMAPLDGPPGLGLATIHNVIRSFDGDLIEMTTNSRNLLWRVYARLFPVMNPFYTLHGWSHQRA